MNSYADKARAASTFAPAVLFCFSIPASCSTAAEPWELTGQGQRDFAVALAQGHMLINLGLAGNTTYQPSNRSPYFVLETEAKRPSDNVEIGAELAAFVGVNGCARLRRFAELESGWDNGVGAPLANSSLATLNYFLEQTRYRPDSVSVFMTQSGNAVINWHTAGGLIELEFSEGKVDYFIEATGEEDSIPTIRAEIKKLERKLSAS